MSVAYTKEEITYTSKNSIPKHEQELLSDISSHGSTLVQEGSIFTWILLCSHQFIGDHCKRGHTQEEQA